MEQNTQYINKSTNYGQLVFKEGAQEYTVHERMET